MMSDTTTNTNGTAPQEAGFHFGTLAFACSVVLLTGLFAQMGLPYAFGGMFLLSPTVGYFWTRREFVPALAVALLSAMSALPDLMVTAYLLAANAAGIVMAIGIRRWSFGRSLTLVTTLIFALHAGSTQLDWQDQRHAATIFINARIAQFQEAAKATDTEESAEMLVERLKLLDQHWLHLNLGLSFGAILLMSAMQLGLLARWLRVGDLLSAPNFRFRNLRPPEWLVWVAILLAICWFIDHRWPWTPLRFIAWNGAIGLTYVYWLNGFALLLYVLMAFRVHSFAITACIIMLFFTGAHTLLATVGFFDVWWEVRPWCDRITGPPPLPPDQPKDNT